MTRNKITRYADNDTPENVKVGNDTYQLFIWAAGRFGIGIIFLIMTWILYQDQRADNELLRNILIENNKALYELKKAIDNKQN